MVGRDFRVTEKTPTSSTSTQPSAGEKNIPKIVSKHPSFALSWVFSYMFFQQERSDWWVASTGVRAGSSSILTPDGERYATMHGISLTPRWCVASRAAGMRRWPAEKLFSGPAQEPSCWTISSVLVQRPPCRSAPIYPGTCTTVTTPKMRASPARCRDSSRNTLRSLPWVRRGRTNLELVYMM